MNQNVNSRSLTTVRRTLRLASLIRLLSVGTDPLQERTILPFIIPFLLSGTRSSRPIPVFPGRLPSAQSAHNMRDSLSLSSLSTRKVLIISRPVSPRAYPDMPTPPASDPSCLSMARSPKGIDVENLLMPREKNATGQGQAFPKHQLLDRVKLPVGWSGPRRAKTSASCGVSGHVIRGPRGSESKVTDGSTLVGAKKRCLPPGYCNSSG
jgi:hypothetical protein